MPTRASRRSSRMGANNSKPNEKPEEKVKPTEAKTEEKRESALEKFKKRRLNEEEKDENKKAKVQKLVDSIDITEDKVCKNIRARSSADLGTGIFMVLRLKTRAFEKHTK